MKTKVFTIASTLAILASSAAFGLTEGSYVGVNLLQTQVLTKQNQPTQKAAEKSSNKYSVGASYKYAFNTDCMFVAPGVFFNYNNAAPKDANASNKRDGVRYNFGVRADIGYDVNEKMAPYAVVGLGRVKFLSSDLSVTSRGKSLDRNTLILGAGLKLAAADNVDFGIEYTTQKFNLSNKKDAAVANKKIASRLNVIQVGVAYKF